MNFLKKYWWVFVLIAGVFLYYWFMIRKNASSTTSTKFVCNNTVAQWDVKMADKIAAISADANWMVAINNEVAAGTSATVAEALAKHADYSLRINDKQCNPNYPLNAAAQFGA